jgi:hypothetical protein
MASKASIGVPNGLVLVLSISGGMAPSSSTLATRVGAVAVEVAGHLAAAGGVTDQDHILEVEGVEELGEVVGVGVQVVAIPGLAGAAVAGAVVGDGLVAVGRDQHGLVERSMPDRAALFGPR